MASRMWASTARIPDVNTTVPTDSHTGSDPTDTLVGQGIACVAGTAIYASTALLAVTLHSTDA